MSALLGCDRCKRTVVGTISRTASVQQRDGKEPEVRYGSESIYVSEDAKEEKTTGYDGTKGWRFIELPTVVAVCSIGRLLICPQCVIETHVFFGIEKVSKS